MNLKEKEAGIFNGNLKEKKITGVTLNVIWIRIL